MVFFAREDGSDDGGTAGDPGVAVNENRPVVGVSFTSGVYGVHERFAVQSGPIYEWFEVCCERLLNAADSNYVSEVRVDHVRLGCAGTAEVQVAVPELLAHDRMVKRHNRTLCV
jgi:hypothetical protein